LKIKKTSRPKVLATYFLPRNKLRVNFDKNLLHFGANVFNNSSGHPAAVTRKLASPEMKPFNPTLNFASPPLTLNPGPKKLKSSSEHGYDSG
jgi:hypothetical protein